jgi:hypothetical protein
MDIANIRVGEPDIEPSTPSHTKGVREGNKGSRLGREPGVQNVGTLKALATPRRSTGIAPKARMPIDPRMPVLTPP